MAKAQPDPAVVRPSLSHRGALRRRYWWVRALLLLLLGGLVAWFVTPVLRVAEVPAIVLPIQEQVVYAPTSGVLTGVTVRRGDAVAAGQILLEVVPLGLAEDMEALRTEVTILEIRLEIAQSDETKRAEIGEIRESLARTQADIRRAEELRARCVVHADVAGTVVEWAESLREGQSVARDDVLGRLADLTAFRVVGYVSDARLETVVPRAGAKFYPADGSRPIAGVIGEVQRTRVAEIPHRALTTESGGPIPVRRLPGGDRALAGSYYEVDLRPAPGATTESFGITGTLRVTGESVTHWEELTRYMRFVLARETGL